MCLCLPGFIAFVVSLVLFGVLVMVGVPVNVLYRKFLSLAVSAILFSFALATLLYIRSFYVRPDELAKGGNSG